MHKSQCLDQCISQAALTPPSPRRSCSGAEPLHSRTLFFLPAAGGPWALYHLSASWFSLVQEVSRVLPAKAVSEWKG